MEQQPSFGLRLGDGPAVLLDGALGTELERRGVHTELPLWSTHALLDAPHVVLAIHREHADAGAEVLTAATFRTQRRSLERSDVAGLADRAGALTREAVALARRAANAAAHPCWVAGSAPPLEDCYRPDLVPGDVALAREHREHAEHLAETGVDVIAVETLNCIREARIAARAAAETGLPFWVSFVCDGDARLLSGESLADAIASVADAGPTLVGVNCLPTSAVAASLAVLASTGVAFHVYANLGAPIADGPGGDGRDANREPDEFARDAASWIAAGARMIGGCCGTRPEHIRALTALRSAL